MGRTRRQTGRILAVIRKTVHRRPERKPRLKRKKDYVKLYRKKWEQCLAEENGDPEEAGEAFEETVNAEEVAGYYIAIYEDEAFRIWKSNTRYKELSAQDREVERILAGLYGQAGLPFPGTSKQ